MATLYIARYNGECDESERYVHAWHYTNAEEVRRCDVSEDHLLGMAAFVQGAVENGNPDVKLVNGMPEYVLSALNSDNGNVQPLGDEDLTRAFGDTGILEYYPELFINSEIRSNK